MESDLDTSLMSRIQKQRKGRSRMEDDFEPRSRSLRNEALKERSGYDEDKDIDTTEHLKKDHESMHAEDSPMSRSDLATTGSRNPVKSADNRTELRPSIRCHEDDFGHDVIVIPDTPSPIFSKFATKNKAKHLFNAREKKQTSTCTSLEERIKSKAHNSQDDHSDSKQLNDGDNEPWLRKSSSKYKSTSLEDFVAPDRTSHRTAGDSNSRNEDVRVDVLQGKGNKPSVANLEKVKKRDAYSAKRNAKSRQDQIMHNFFNVFIKSHSDAQRRDGDDKKKSTSTSKVSTGAKNEGEKGKGADSVQGKTSEQLKQVKSDKMFDLMKQYYQSPKKLNAQTNALQSSDDSPGSKFLSRLMKDSPSKNDIDVNTVEMQRARDRAMHKIVSLRNTKRETAKQFLDQLYDKDKVDGSKGRRSNEININNVMEGNHVSDEGSMNGATERYHTGTSDLPYSSKNRRENKKRKTHDSSSQDEAKTYSLPPPMPIDHRDLIASDEASVARPRKQKCKSSCIAGKESESRASESTLHKYSEESEKNRGSEIGVVNIRSKLPHLEPKQQDVATFPDRNSEVDLHSSEDNFPHRGAFVNTARLGWPSDSDSDSTDDEMNNIPLREILNTTPDGHVGHEMQTSNWEKSNGNQLREGCVQKRNSQKTEKIKSERSQDGCSCKHRCTRTCKANSESVKTEASTRNIFKVPVSNSREDPFCLSQRSNSQRSRIENSNSSNKDDTSRENNSVINLECSEARVTGSRSRENSNSRNEISISSIESLNDSDVELMMAEDFTSVTPETMPNSRSRVHPALTRISPVAKSLRRGRHFNNSVSGDRMTIGQASDNGRSNTEAEYLGVRTLQSPLLASDGVGSGGGNKVRNAVPLSSATARVPGLKRSRTSASKGHTPRTRSGNQHHLGFSPASSLISPRGWRRRDSDIARAVEQANDDEEMARRLQEEMDLEFALTLQNMENEPPQPQFGSHHDNETLFSFTQRVHTHRRARAELNFFHGIEDALLSSDSDDSSQNEHSFLQPTSPARRPRTRSVRAARAAQRLHSHHAAMLGDVNSFLSMLHNIDHDAPRSRRRGRHMARTRFIVGDPGEGDDYEDLLNLAEVLGEVKKRGLSATQASLLPERKFEATSNPDDNLECMICMCEYEVNDKLRILPCVHEFHSSCIDRWIQNNATCPICRVEVKV